MQLIELVTHVGFGTAGVLVAGSLLAASVHPGVGCVVGVEDKVARTLLGGEKATRRFPKTAELQY